MKTLKVRFDNSYGKERFYPVNDTAKNIMAVMPRRNCFNRQDLERLKSDFEIEVVKDEVSI